MKKSIKENEFYKTLNKSGEIYFHSRSGEITTDDLYEMRDYFIDAVSKMQNEIEGTCNLDTSIEGDGFNIAFYLNGKRFFCRVEVNNLSGGK
jgi:hypothetical protein